MSGESEITPGRKTHVILDPPRWSTSEPQFQLRRAGQEICRGGVDATNSSYITRIASGALGLTPYQKFLRSGSEFTPPAGMVLDLSKWNTSTNTVEKPHYRAPSDLSGVTVQSGVASSGLLMMVKTVPSGQSWDQNLTSDIAVLPQPDYAGKTAEMDRHAVTKDKHPQNIAHTWRFKTPLSDVFYNTYYNSLYFGGAVNSDGNGQYCLRVAANNFDLFEYSESKDATTKWWLVDSWKFAPMVVGGQMIVVHIRPVTTPRGNLLIEFECSAQAQPQGIGSLVQSLYTGPSQSSTHFFRIRRDKHAIIPPTKQKRTQVTGEGHFRVDMAREARVPWQLSVWRYFTPGYCTDHVFSIPFQLSVRGSLEISWLATVPAGTTLVGKLFDSTTNNELSLLFSGDSYRRYSINPQQPNYYAKFEFTSNSDASETPLLWEYTVTRPAVAQYNNPASYELANTSRKEAVLGLSITGSEADISHETASIEVNDPTNTLTAFRRSASIPIRIETQYDPGDAAKRSVLFDGYIQRVDSMREGYDLGKGFAGGSSDYPNADWYRYQLAIAGMWVRLERTLTMFRLDLQTPDRNASPDANGIYPPLKVTDVVRALLRYAGWVDADIDVPDSPIRFWNGGAESGQSLLIDPLLSVGNVVQQILKDWLGWFLVWDGNAGTTGKIRAIQPPPNFGTYNNLANFTLDLPPAGRITTNSKSYGNSLPFTGVNPTGWIKRGTFKSWVKPPEGNAVCVSALGDYLPDHGRFRLTNWVCNAKSYNFFTDNSGTPISTADPNHPDYLGEMVPIVLINHSFGTQDEVDIFCRRIYDVSCHAIKGVTFTAPLLLVTDPTDGLQSQPRPLRYYDPVTITRAGVASQWLVRNCNPVYKKDHLQMAVYELEAPRQD